MRNWLIVLPMFGILLMSACQSAQDYEEVPLQLHGNKKEKARVNPSGQFPIVDEKIKLTVMVMEDSRIANYTDDTFRDWYEDYTNIHIEWIKVGPNYADGHLDLLLSEQELPDILLNMDVSPLQQMHYGQQDIFIPLNEFIKKYGLEINQLFQKYPNMKKTITAPDGNIYALPRVNEDDYSRFPQKLWIYKPWLDQLNLDMPSTTDELYEVLTAFKERDPNGNGVQDEIPMAGHSHGKFSGIDSFLMNSFIFYNLTTANRLILENGTVDVSFNKEGFRKGLKYLHQLYEDGLILPETFLQDELQLKNQVENDIPIVGVVPSSQLSDFTRGEDGSQRYAEYVPVPPLQGPDGLRVTPYNAYPYEQGVFVITSHNEHPEASFRWVDALYSEEVMRRLHLAGEDVKDQLQTNIMTDDASSLQPLQPAEIRSLYEPYKQDSDKIVPPLFFTEHQAIELEELGSTIHSFVDKMFVRFVVGDALIDKQWDVYVQTLDDMNVDRYIQIIQAAYDAQYR